MTSLAPQARAVDEDQWMVLRPEKRSGSLSLADLQTLVARGHVAPDDLVWREGWDRWVPAYQIGGLAPPPQPTPPQPAPEQPVEGGHEEPRTFKDRVLHELRAYLAITVYVWLMLVLLRLHEIAIGLDYNLDLKGHGYLIIQALIIGKVVLIAEALRLGDRYFPDAPVFKIALKALFFALALAMFHLAEHVVSELWSGRNPIFEVTRITPRSGFRAAVMISLMTAALVPYFVMKDFEALKARQQAVVNGARKLRVVPGRRA